MASSVTVTDSMGVVDKFDGANACADPDMETMGPAYLVVRREDDSRILAVYNEPGWQKYIVNYE